MTIDTAHLSFKDLVVDTLARVETLLTDPRIISAGKVGELDRAKQILMEVQRRMDENSDIDETEIIALMNDVVTLIMQATRHLPQPAASPERFGKSLVLMVQFYCAEASTPLETEIATAIRNEVTELFKVMANNRTLIPDADAMDRIRLLQERFAAQPGRKAVAELSATLN